MTAEETSIITAVIIIMLAVAAVPLAFAVPLLAGWAHRGKNANQHPSIHQLIGDLGTAKEPLHCFHGWV